MGDDITIGVTEIVNNIEVTSQPNDQIVDISVIDNADDVTLNITPTVIEINVNKGSSYAKWGTILGTLSDQTDLQDALDLKADLVDGKVPSYQLPSYVDDVIEVANYAALPVVGESGKIYVTIDNNHIFRWTGSIYVEITDNTAVWGAITGTLSSQSDLQSALNTKVPYTGATSNVNLGEYGLTGGFLALDTTPTSTPTGIGTIYWDSANRTAALIDGDGDTTLQIGQEERILVHNNTGSTLTDGQVVYVTGSTGNLPSVSLANASSETTSAATLGVVTESIAHGADGFITTSGIVNGLNTLAFNEGDLLWLGTTAGTFTATKPISPNHLVLIGYVIKKAGGNGSILVKIQNTQELEESSDVLFSGLINNDVLTYESATSLWKNKSIATILGYTPANDSNVVHLTGNESIGGIKTFTGGSTVFDNAYGGILNFKVSGVDVGNINFGTTFTQFTSKTTSGYLFKNSTLANSLSISNSGNGTFLGSITATSIIKSGGTSSQFLKADGSVDSSTYASDSLVVKLAGSQTITGSKLFTANTSFQGATIIDYIGGISLKQTGLSLYNQMVAVDGGFNFYENAGTVFSFKIRPEYISFGDSINNAILNASNLTAERTFDLPNASGTIALTSNIPSVSGTTNYIPKFTGANSLGNSLIYDNGTNVGIGTTSPSSLLHLTSTTSPYLRLQTTNGAGKQWSIGVDNAYSNGLNFSEIGVADGRLFLQAGGNVGIGTTSPSTLLNISGLAPTFTINRQPTGTQPKISYTDNGSEFAYIQPSAASSVMRYDMGPSAGWGGIHAFYTDTTEKMRITSGGNVGIGTTNASGRLTLNNPISDGSVPLISIRDTSNVYEIGYLNFNQSTDMMTLMNKQSYSASGISLGTNNTERMRITSGGNVGIGTTSPSYILQTKAGSGFVGAAFSSSYAATSIIGNDANSSWFGQGTNGLGSAYVINNTSGYAQIELGGSPRFYVNSSGNVGIGTTSPSYQLQLSTDSAAKPTSALWTIASDERIKENINSYTKGLNELLKINPITYDYNGLGGFKKGKGGVGIIAQEIAEILPDSVSSIKGKLNETDEEEIDILNFNGHELTYILINAVKELKAEIDLLKQK